MTYSPDLESSLDDVISFTVPGPPIAKQRPQVVRDRYGRSRSYTPGKTKEYERDIAWEAKRATNRKLEGLLAVTLHFFGARGDIDNVAKSALDGMSGICFDDDRQVVELHVYVERKGKPPRTEIEVRPKSAEAVA